MNYFKAYTEGGEKEGLASEPQSFASEFAQQERTEKSSKLGGEGSYADQFVKNAYAEEFSQRERAWIDDFHKGMLFWILVSLLISCV
jgi:hypothetical protein